MYGTYQPQSYLPQSYQPQSYQQVSTTQPNYGIQWVQGTEGARAYILPPNSSALLMDSETSTFYIKTTDASGMPSLRIFDYVERTPQVPAPKEEIPQIDLSIYATRDELNSITESIKEMQEEIAHINKGSIVIPGGSSTSRSTKKGADK